jgi:FkbH-like protein
MKKSIKLYSSSLLLPGNLKWKEISKDYFLDFGNYGMAQIDFKMKSNELKNNFCNVWIIFSEDTLTPSKILDISESKKLNENEIQSLINSYLNPLIDFLNQSPNPFIISFLSLGRLENPIANSLSRSLLHKFNRTFEETLFDLQNKFKNLYILNIDESFAKEGVSRCYDKRNYYLTRCHLSMIGLSILTKKLKDILQRLDQPRKKVLILDCDNTLWGGVVGDLGISGIKLGQDGIGQAFKDFQINIKNLTKQGIILAISSKNNEKDVIEIFDHHQEMVLKKEDIVIFKANWQDKTNSIREIASELDLSLDSLVFWDDSSFERDQIKNNLPDVCVIEPDGEIFNWANQLLEIPEFSQFNTTNEDFKKLSQYKARAFFQSELKKSYNKIDYLKTISMSATSFFVDESTIQRAQQLCSKTNQFNLLTKRHTEENLRFLIQQGNILKIYSLKDKFGDHGLVGLAIAKKTNYEQVYFLDSFILSCRVIGRYFESFMLSDVIYELRKRNVKYLLANYEPTSKNQVCSMFLSDHNFESIKKLIFFSGCNDYGNDACFIDLNNYSLKNIEIYEDINGPS